MRGVVAFTGSCAVVAGLTLVPPELGRWIALGMLALVVMTPAVGRYASAGRSSGEAVSPLRERER